MYSEYGCIVNIIFWHKIDMHKKKLYVLDIIQMIGRKVV